MSTRKSILFAVLSILTLCAAALMHAWRREKAREDELPSPFVQPADLAAVHELGHESLRPSSAPASVEAERALQQQTAAVSNDAGAAQDRREATAEITDEDEAKEHGQTGGQAPNDGYEVPLASGSIHVVGPVATPAELGYSPQAQYDREQFTNEMRYAPQYDRYGQQVIEDQGAAPGVIYDPYYGYGYGFGYGPVTNYGEAPLNGPADASGQTQVRVQEQQ
jgi:hypothetical protein